MLVMTEKTMQDTTHTCGTPIASVDCAYGQYPLMIRCCTCGQLFVSDYEETRCGQCVADRELTPPHSSTAQR